MYLGKWKFQSAFGLAEVILGMFVLSIAIIATIQPIAKSVPYFANNRDLITADQLAQEGIGIVRNVRDNDFVDTSNTDGTSGRHNNDGFDNFPKTNAAGRATCVVDYTGTEFRDNSAVNCPNCCNPGIGTVPMYKFLTLQAGAGVNTYKSTNVFAGAKFARKLVFEGVSGNYRVTSYVVWKPFPSSNTTNNQTAFNNNFRDLTEARCTRANHCAFSQALFSSWNVTTP